MSRRLPKETECRQYFSITLESWLTPQRSLFAGDFKPDMHTFQEYALAHASTSCKASCHDQSCDVYSPLLMVLMVDTCKYDI